MAAVYVITALLAFQAASGGAAQRPTPRDLEEIARGVRLMTDPPVMLAAPLASADGAAQGPLTLLTKESRTFYVTSPPGSCEASITASMPDQVRDGWRVTASVLSYTSRIPTVSVEWARLDATGTSRLTARGSSSVTLPMRERVTVDQQAVVDPQAPCSGRLRSLELTYMAGITVSNDGAQADVPGTYEAQIFVVHQSPEGVESFRRIVVPFNPAGTGFSIRVPALVTAFGHATVTVEGTFRAVVQADGTTGLGASIVRTINGDVPALRSAGGSANTVPFPAVNDVLSFDLPLEYAASRGRGGGGGGGRSGGGRGTSGSGAVAGGGAGTRASGTHLFEGHHLSLRLQLRRLR